MGISPQIHIGRSDRRFVANKQFTDRLIPKQAFINKLDTVIQENFEDKKKTSCSNILRNRWYRKKQIAKRAAYFFK